LTLTLLQGGDIGANWEFFTGDERKPSSGKSLSAAHRGGLHDRSQDSDRDLPHTKGLKDGTVSVPVSSSSMSRSRRYRRFPPHVRTLDFDVCEMAITTYLTRKAHDKPFTALPVFVLRQFHTPPSFTT